MIIDITGDFSNEKNEVFELKLQIDNSVRKLENELEALAAAWQDEKSKTFLAKQHANMNEIKTFNNNAKMKADEYVDAIVKQLEIYR